MSMSATRPVSGTRPLLVILAEANDVTPTAGQTRAFFEDQFFGPRPSVVDYFTEVSYGDFTYTEADVLGWYKSPYTRAEIESDMWAAASDSISQAINDFDFDSYDVNDDGVVTNEELTIFVIVNADPGAWHCPSCVGGLVTGSGKIVEGECSIAPATRGIGSFCHELGHDLGLPDLYDTDDSNGGSAGIGHYGLMGSGSWCGPTQMTAWEKTQLGWLTPTPVTENGFYDIRDSETHAEAYLLATPDHGTNEYFLVENRWRGTSYDAEMGTEGNLNDEGIIIYHIDEAWAASWWSRATNNVNANEAHKAVDVECRDSKTSHEQNADHLDMGWNRGDDTDLWDSTVDGFCDYSPPCKNFWYDGSYSQMRVAQIPAPGPTMRTYLAVRSDVWPEITGITPISAVVEQGSVSFTVSGTNFQDGATVEVSRTVPGIGTVTLPTSNVQVHGTTGAQTITGILDLSSVQIFGAYDITVRNPSLHSATLTGGFTLGQDTPRINGITPTEGRDLAASLPFTISGYGFASGAQVELFQNTPLGGSTISATGEQVQGSGAQQTITGTFDLTSAVVGAYNLTVRNPSGRATTLENGFTVTTNPWPKLTDISPTEARDGSTRPVPITIAGSNFLDGATIVLRQTTQLGTFTITATGVQVHNVIGGQTITANLDLYSAALGTYNVTVTNPGGHSATLQNSFTVTRRLSVASIDPVTGGQGTTVAITNLAGTGFLSGASVMLESYGLHSIPATDVVVASGSKITCTFTIPLSTATGPWNVTVTNTNGDSATLMNGFQIVRPTLSVSSITPNTGGQRTTVSITNLAGTGFQDGATVKLRRLDLSTTLPDDWLEIAATNVAVVSPTRITCQFVIPRYVWIGGDDYDLGTWNVVVTNPNTDSATFANGFTVVRPTPSVASITPNAGAQGTTVAITNLAGGGFQNGATVKLQAIGYADIAATNVSVTSPTSITCEIPIPPTAALGGWNVTVRNPNGDIGSRMNAFHIIKPTLSVSSITPTSGLQGETASITNLAGGGYLPGATVKLQRTGSVDIGATDVVVASPTQITCRIPIPGTAALGSWNVTVTNPNTDSVTLTNAFRISAPALTVSSITPNTGLKGTTVTITNLSGTGFQPGTTVMLQHLPTDDTVGMSIPATSVTVVSLTKITCQFALPLTAATGVWNMVVTEPGGTSALLPDGFTVLAPPPSVTAIAPNKSSRGTTVSATITGTGFTAPATVKLSKIISLFPPKMESITATNVTVHSATQITGTFAVPATASIGTWDVDVTNPDGQGGTLFRGFTVPAPPTVTAIAPNISTRGATVSVTITGMDFAAPATVRLMKILSGYPPMFELITATDVVVQSATQITGTFAVPATAYNGTWTVVVTNPDAQAGSLSGAFTVLETTPPPSVLPFPGSTNPPRDLDSNGTYEDINGNGAKDFADIVLYFTHMKWIIQNEPILAFDYNGNGRIDFADVVWLFNTL